MEEDSEIGRGLGGGTVDLADEEEFGFIRGAVEEVPVTIDAEEADNDIPVDLEVEGVIDPETDAEGVKGT